MGKSGLADLKVRQEKKDELPACPQPCRPAPSVPEVLYPLSCKHSLSGDQGSSEILNMISWKGDEGRESMSTGCPPSCYCGSPPTRLANPLVHDVRFIHQAELLQSKAV